MAFDPEGPLTGELPRVNPDDTGGPPRPHRFRPLRLSLKLAAIALVIYFAWGVIPDVKKAMEELRSVNPFLLGLGLGLQLAALFCYSLLTKAALGPAGHIVSRWRLFRIQMSTKALSNIVPGGSAAGPALGYRLLTLSGVDGPSAGFALATAGLGSAVVLNLILWIGLIASIPIRGVNKGYGVAAIAGIIVMLVAGLLVLGLMDGQGRAERAFRWVARKLHLNEDRTGAAVRQIAERLEDIISDRQLLIRTASWAAANWLLDAASLWVFLRAFGESMDVDALIIAFGLVNILQVVPIMPGGLGIVEGAYALQLPAFGVPKTVAALGVASYRIGQYWIPTLLGGILYATLRVGPWSIKRRSLATLRALAAESEANPESVLDFSARFSRGRKAQQ
ncbi:MAG: flippase-like domain-containing protein [Acidimicrobiaceae bacterium]|nr:flippase-like domain-containing protein [Ilumatobacter sp.]MCB9379470.1 flippase-like domain-containing protein [Acidimicrobiaceae bacterium]MCO5332237.1 flippase-like domain-containing protein [Ilumatobacteraceae bacterium]